MEIFLLIIIIVAIATLGLIFYFNKDENNRLFKQINENIKSNQEQIKNVNKEASDNNKHLDELEKDIEIKLREISLKENEMSRTFKENIKELKEETKREIESSEVKSQDKITAGEKVLLEKISFQEKKIKEQAKILEILHQQNQELRKKIEIFTEIDSDSKNLNIKENIEEQDKKIQQALEEIKRSDLKVDDIVERVEKVKQIFDQTILDDEQKRAYELMESTSGNFFITGKAGTGKSFLLKIFEKATKKRVLKVAPTGVSALNIEGTTIHSVFGFKNLEDIDVDLLTEETLVLKTESKAVLKNVDVIIIDEISMVRADTFHKIDKILRIVNKNDLYFGGKQIIVFGDLFQLPPVAKKDEEIYLNKKYRGIYFFNTDSYKNGGFKFIELQINHRQEGDSQFFEILNRMREGVLQESDLDVINSRVVDKESDLRRIIRLYPRRLDAENLNNLELSKIPAKEYQYDAVVVKNKTNNQNLIIENYFQAATCLKLKVGALVMMTRNDLGERWVNGTLGIVSKLDEKSIEVTIDGQKYSVGKEKFEVREARYYNNQIDYEVILEIQQYPILLAYAITIHKSQGSTYKKIICDTSCCFSPGQTYVAFSRCNSLGGVNLLKKLTLNDVKVDSKVKEFYKSQI